MTQDAQSQIELIVSGFVAVLIEDGFTEADAIIAIQEALRSRE